MQVHVAMDPVTKTSKGIAFVAFVDPSCAVKAFEELDKTSFQGRLLHILPAAERSGVQTVEEKDGKSTLRGDKEKKRKENASKEFNWSFLYMNVSRVVFVIYSTLLMNSHCVGRCCCFLNCRPYEYSKVRHPQP